MEVLEGGYGLHNTYCIDLLSIGRSMHIYIYTYTYFMRAGHEKCVGAVGGAFAQKGTAATGTCPGCCLYCTFCDCKLVYSPAMVSFHQQP